MKGMKKFMGMLCCMTVFAASVLPAFAEGPWDYESDYQLAVIANEEVDIQGSVEIEGSIYSAEDITVNVKQENNIAGSLIAPEFDIKGGNKDGAFDTVYNENPQENTCVYDGFDIPDIENQAGETVASEWGKPVTVSEDTYFESLDISGNGLIIDTTEGDVTIVVESISFNNASITVQGSHTVNFYVEETKSISNVMINGGNAGLWENPDNIESVIEFMDQMGDSGRFNLYLKGDDNKVEITSNARISANIFVDAEKLKVDHGAKINGNVTMSGDDFDLNGSAYIRGAVCVPDADSRVHGTGTIIGQIHTDSIKITNNGRIYYAPADANEETEETPPVQSPEPSEEPEASQPPEPTKDPEPTKKPGIGGNAAQYAYIFGYEPKVIRSIDEGGNGYQKVSIQMAPDDTVTREQVCAMVMRLMSQMKSEQVEEDYSIPDQLTDVSDWAKRGVGYICSVGAYDDVDIALSGTGAVTRGEVARIVVYGLGLTLQDNAKVFADVDDHTPNKMYIDIMTSNGYMEGDGDTFRSEGFMTRAEFCAMFNKVTGRQDYTLMGYDENGQLVEITPETYYFDDLNNVPQWQIKECLLATSAFDENGFVDLADRLENIRNVVDAYDAQKQY